MSTTSGVVIKHSSITFATRYFKNDKSKDWKDNQRNVYSFDTVEDFWALYNHMLQPSELQVCQHTGGVVKEKIAKCALS